jgi:hypothetical protein
MKTHLDPLSDRAADWVAQVGPQDADNLAGAVPGDLALRGHALCEALRRRGDSADAPLIDAIETRLSPLPAAGTTTVAHFVESATTRWNDLMNSLDREEENFEHVRRETRDVFFYVLDALILAEEAGGPDAARAAQQLFNAVVADLYAFEPMADVAAELQPRGRAAEYRLSDLLCTGVAGLFEDQVRPRALSQDNRVEVSEPVEEFVPLSVWLQRGDVSDARQPLTLATLAKRLAEVPAWYVKWSAQQLRVAVNAAARELTVHVIEGAAPSRALDAWQVRTGTTGKPVAIKGGVAAISLPDKLDASKFVLQIREPSSGAEWTDVFARVGA